MRTETFETALALFLTQGFEATTVEQIAEAAGMSKSSFFRYFASKEDVVIDRVDQLIDQLVDTLEARPLDEPAWDALQHTMEAMLDSYAEVFKRQRGAFFKVITSSPTLRAASLQRVDQGEQRLAQVLLERSAHRGEARDETRNVLTRATVGAALACVKAVLPVALSSEDPTTVVALLAVTMNALRPSGRISTDHPPRATN